MKNVNKSVASTHVTSSPWAIDDKWCRHIYDTEDEANKHRQEMIEDGYKVLRFERSNLASYDRDEKWIAEYKKSNEE